MPKLPPTNKFHQSLKSCSPITCLGMIWMYAVRLWNCQVGDSTRISNVPCSGFSHLILAETEFLSSWKTEVSQVCTCAGAYVYLQSLPANKPSKENSRPPGRHIWYLCNCRAYWSAELHSHLGLCQSEYIIEFCTATFLAVHSLLFSCRSQTAHILCRVQHSNVLSTAAYLHPWIPTCFGMQDWNNISMTSIPHFCIVLWLSWHMLVLVHPAQANVNSMLIIYIRITRNFAWGIELYLEMRPSETETQFSNIRIAAHACACTRNNKYTIRVSQAVSL